VALLSNVFEHEHGKGIPDGQANTATGAVQRGIEDGHHVDTGTRVHVLYLAQMHPSPRTPSTERVGLWAPGRDFYGYYDPSLWGEDEDFNLGCGGRGGAKRAPQDPTANVRVPP
jgi:hypothetical protein